MSIPDFDNALNGFNNIMKMSISTETIQQKIITSSETIVYMVILSDIDNDEHNVIGKFLDVENAERLMNYIKSEIDYFIHLTGQLGTNFNVETKEYIFTR